ncbi:MAG: cupin domain-containing protein [Ferruginibacter sp.]
MKILLSLLFQLIAICSLAQLTPVASGVIHWADITVKKDALREGRKIANGSTSELEYFDIHATTQLKCAVARPPHTQKDIEELIIIKEGKMKCSIGNKITELGKGSVLLIPPGEAQTFENIGDSALTYYVFMYRSKKINLVRSQLAGGTIVINADTLAVTKTATKSTTKYFDRPTTMCDNFEMHITALNTKGPSHAAHTHADTEVILVIEGQTEMTIDGNHFTGVAGDIFIANSGTLHNVGNPSNAPCSYFAFKWR